MLVLVQFAFGQQDVFVRWDTQSARFEKVVINQFKDLMIDDACTYWIRFPILIGYNCDTINNNSLSFDYRPFETKQPDEYFVDAGVELPMHRRKFVTKRFLKGKKIIDQSFFFDGVDDLYDYNDKDLWLNNRNHKYFIIEKRPGWFHFQKYVITEVDYDCIVRE